MPWRIPRVKQRSGSDCGVACLASIGRYYGQRIPLERIGEFAGLNFEGTTVLGLVFAAERMGFAARGVRARASHLSTVPLPAIAHLADVTGRIEHFAVVHRVTKAHVLLMDPQVGRLRRCGRGAFEARWTGVLILVAPVAGPLVAP